MKIAPNPILSRELSERMRSMRAPVVISLYLLLLGTIVYFTERSLVHDEVSALFEAASAGRIVFHTLTFCLVLFLCFMVPAFSASAISSERERQTLHLVQVTLMSPRAIVLGKLGAAGAYLGLLVLATLPLVGISFLLGGVTAGDVVRGYAIILFVGLVLAMLCIALSARTRRTVSSTVLAFGLVGLLSVGTFIVYGFVRVVQSRDAVPDKPPTWLLSLNPFSAPASLLADGAGPGPWDGMASMLRESEGHSEVEFGAVAVPDAEPGVVLQRFEDRVGPRQRTDRFWIQSVLVYAALGVAAFFYAAQSVQAPSARIKIGRRRRGAVTDG